MLKKTTVACFLVLGMVLLSGCGFPVIPYLIDAGRGELRVVGNTVPMDEALEDPNLSPENREKLLWVRQVRDFAEHSLGLRVGRAYQGFYDTGGDAAVYNLSAACKDALEPYTWCFPILGRVEYLGYFSKDLATEYGRQLKEDGYDIVIYGAVAYSTGGFFPDPLYSSLLSLDKPLLADTVIHELTHNTIFVAGDSGFNESIANFVGRKGALTFVEAVAGRESDLYRQAMDELADQQTVNEFLAGVYRDLQAFYSRTDLTPEQKIEQRAEVFQAWRDRFTSDYLPRFHDPERMASWGELPTNNAWVLLNRRYNSGLDLFEAVYQACGQNLSQAITIFTLAAGSDNATRYLQDWLKSRAAKTVPVPSP